MKKLKEFFKEENLKKVFKNNAVRVTLAIILIISIVAVTNVIVEKNAIKNEKIYTEMLGEVSQSYVDFVFKEKRDTVSQEIEFLKFDNSVRERLIDEKLSYKGVDMTGIIKYQKECIKENNKFIDELKKIDGNTKIERSDLESEFGKAYTKTVGNSKMVNLMIEEITKLENLVYSETITREQFNLILNSYFYS